MLPNACAVRVAIMARIMPFRDGDTQFCARRLKRLLRRRQVDNGAANGSYTTGDCLDGAMDVSELSGCARVKIVYSIRQVSKTVVYSVYARLAFSNSRMGSAIMSLTVRCTPAMASRSTKLRDAHCRVPWCAVSSHPLTSADAQCHVVAVGAWVIA
jgi:hypothetical protein